MREQGPVPGGPGGLRPEKSPGNSAEHPSFWVQGCDWALRQGLETEAEGSRWSRMMPATAAQRCTEAARVQGAWGRGLGADGAAAREPRHGPGQDGEGRRRSPKEALWAAPGDGEWVRREGGLRGSGRQREGDEREPHPRPLLPASAARTVQYGLQSRGGREEKGEGRSLYLALTRRVLRPRLRFPLGALLPSRPCHPLLRRSVPLVPRGASANSTGPRREAGPTLLPISARFLSTDGARSQ